MRPSDILFSDAILLVEGSVGRNVFCKRQPKNPGMPLAERNVKIIPVGGYPRGRHKIEFWAEVGHDAALPLYLILDNGAGAEAEKAINGKQVPRGHCMILDQDALEDVYPWHVLQEVLLTEFGEEVTTEIPVGQRVAELQKLLETKYGKNGWKPLLAEAVAGRLTSSQVESEMKQIFDFLHLIHRRTSLE